MSASSTTVVAITASEVIHHHGAGSRSGDASRRLPSNAPT
jgi:hypothetical protein